MSAFKFFLVQLISLPLLGPSVFAGTSGPAATSIPNLIKVYSPADMADLFFGELDAYCTGRPEPGVRIVISMYTYGGNAEVQIENAFGAVRTVGLKLTSVSDIYYKNKVTRRIDYSGDGFKLWVTPTAGDGEIQTVNSGRTTDSGVELTCEKGVPVKRRD